MAEPKRKAEEQEVETPVRASPLGLFHLANLLAQDARIITVCVTKHERNFYDTDFPTVSVHVLRMVASNVFGDTTLAEHRVGETNVFNIQLFIDERELQEADKLPVFVQRFGKNCTPQFKKNTAGDRPFLANACKVLLNHLAWSVRLSDAFREKHKDDGDAVRTVESQRIAAQQMGAMSDADLVVAMDKADAEQGKIGLSNYFAPAGSEPLRKDSPMFAGPYDAVVCFNLIYT